MRIHSFLPIRFGKSPMTVRAALYVALILILGLTGSAAQDTRMLRAGAATSNITPFIGAGIVGGWSVPKSTHIHDELHVRCLVLDDGRTRLAFAVVDSVSVNREVFGEAKRLIHESTGLPPERAMMSATHTHSGPSARGENPLGFRKPLDEYQTFMARRIADGVRRAIHNLEPARVGWGIGQVPQHVFNRRWLLKNGKTAVNPFGGRDRAVMNPGHQNPDILQPAGPTNPEVYFLSVQSANGRPIALLANYWLHYVGGVGPGHISADYFGLFCNRIQELLKADRQDPPFVGILANGPCGDVNNINFSAPRENRAPYEKMRVVADDVAREVFRVWQTIHHREYVELRAAQAELELKMRRPTPDLVARARQVLERPKPVPPIQRHEEEYARRTLAAKDWPDNVSVILQTFRIGDLGIAAIPFETFTETGLEIKATSPFDPTFTIELANGGYGYLPTPAQHEIGGYETWLGTNRVDKQSERKIVAKILELFSTMR